MYGQSLHHVAGGDRPISTEPHVYGPPKRKETGLDWAAIRPAEVAEPAPSCSTCGAEGFVLSENGLCDGCEAELTRFNTPPPALEVVAEIVDDPEPVTFTPDVMAIAMCLKVTVDSKDPLVQAARGKVIVAAQVLRAVAMAERKSRRTTTPSQKALRKPADSGRGPRRVRNDNINVPEFVRRYQAGETIPEIGDALGNSPHTVRRHLKSAGITMRDDRQTHTGGANALEIRRPELVEQVRDLYLYERLSQALISERLGISVNTVRRIMERNGVEAREGQAGGGDTLVSYRERLQELGVTPKQVRAWAAANGHQVHPRGAIRREVLDAFETAHQ